MRAGYLTLFGAILAFSAYQGSSAKPGTHTPGQKSQDRGGRNNGGGPPSSPTDKLATIGAGVCDCKIGKKWKDPCKGCGPICPAKDLLDLIEGYFQPYSDGQPENDTSNDDKPNSDKSKDDGPAWRVPKDQAKNVRFVIATLPDPVHTHMALFFDRQIEAIEKAAQAQRYLFSRSWMPWDIAAHPESTDFTVRMSQDEVQQRREDLPGLMIFRKPSGNPDSTDTLFVFVVGETPTGGLHTRQFQNALNIQTSIAAPSSRTLLVFGPTFSGSLQSLNTILVSYHGDFSRILIRSGTVSSFKAADTFCRAAQQEAGTYKLSTRPDFATFQFSDEYEEFYLSAFFADRHQLHSHIAVLSEDETQYGNQEQPESNVGDQSTSCPSEPPKPLRPPIRLYFPREIAQLRSAYEQDIKAQPAPNPGNYIPPQTRLPLSLGVTGNDDDSVPAFAPLQTPISQDAVMQAIVSTLRNLHAKVVIIRASDPLDTIFLARYLRQNYPQARLVTSGADLLMVYDVIDPRFHGILAVTSYPLLNGVEFPGRAEDLCHFVNEVAFPNCPSQDTGAQSNEVVQRVFSDNYSAGPFNAVLSLLAPDALTTGSERLPDASYAQFGLPSFLEDHSHWKPHLWLTTVGRDGYWPVSVLDDIPGKDINRLAEEIQTKQSFFTKAGDQPDIKEPTPTVRELPARGVPTKPFRVHFTIGWSIFWLTTVALSLVLSYLLHFPPPKGRSHSEILNRFSKNCSLERNSLLIAGSLLVLLTHTLFVFPAAAWLKKFGGGPDPAGLPVSGTLCIVLFSAGYLSLLLVLFWVSRKHLPQLPSVCRVALVLIIGVAGVLALLFDGLWMVCYFYLLSLWISVMACWKVLQRTQAEKQATILRVTGWGAALLLIVLMFLFACLRDGASNPTEFPSFIYRYIQTGSGVSPLLPLFFILAAWIWWWWQSLTGVASAEDKDMKLPLLDGVLRSVGGYDGVRLKPLADNSSCSMDILQAIPRPKSILILAGLGFLCILVLMSPSEIAEAFESIWYRRMYWYLFLYPALFLICYLTAHILVLWLRFRNLLRAVEALPFRRGFGDVKTLTWKPLWKLAGSGSSDFRAVFIQELSVLKRIQNIDKNDSESKTKIKRVTCQTERQSSEENLSPDADPKKAATTITTIETMRCQTEEAAPEKKKSDDGSLEKFTEWIAEVMGQTNDLASNYDQAVDSVSSAGMSAGRFCQGAGPIDSSSERIKSERMPKQFDELQRKMAEAAARGLAFVNEQWGSESYSPSDEQKSSDKDDEKSGPPEPPAKDLTLRAVEHFLCLFYLNVILVPLRRLQTLILALAGVFVFVLLSYSSYPFESRESFHALLISILFAISLVVGIVYGQMYSDPLLSRITNTKPGELGLDFWVKLGTFVFIPVLSLLSVQFPEVNSFLFSWLQPALQSIK